MEDASVSDEPILDEAAIAELRESVGGDTEFVADLVRTYLSEGEAHLEQMSAAAAAGDAGAIVRPAHTLKSSSASVGAARLSRIARDIEVAGREGGTDSLRAAVEEAQQVWDETVAAMRARGMAG